MDSRNKVLDDDDEVATLVSLADHSAFVSILTGARNDRVRGITATRGHDVANRAFSSSARGPRCASHDRPHNAHVNFGVAE